MCVYMCACAGGGEPNCLPRTQLYYSETPKCGSGRMWDLGAQGGRQRPLHETMRLVEARLERHVPGGSMPSEAPKHCKIQRRRDAPKMAILEAECAQNAPGRSTMRPPEALLTRNPTWESPHFSGLTNYRCDALYHAMPGHGAWRSPPQGEILPPQSFWFAQIYLCDALAHQNRSDFCNLRLRCPSRTQNSPAISETRPSSVALRCKAEMDFELRFPSPKSLFLRGISGDLAPSTRKSLEIAIVRFWRAKEKPILEDITIVVQSPRPIKESTEELRDTIATGVRHCEAKSGNLVNLVLGILTFFFPSQCFEGKKVQRGRTQKKAWITRSCLEHSPHRQNLFTLVSRYSTIGDTISCDAPYSAIGFRGKLFLRYPPSKVCLWTAIGHFEGKKWGCSSDSLRYHRKHSATGVLPHLSRY